MFSNNISYWNEFYKKNTHIASPSGFCLFVLQYLSDKNIDVKNILDAGCGNGRDSLKLSEKYNVTGVDNNGFILENSKNFTFLNENFIKLNKSKYDLIYSRFTFHSIKNEEQLLFLKTIENNSYLFIETRSDKGINTERYHGDTHFRNFTNSLYIKKLLTSLGFNILFFEESDNFAIYKNENPICIRIIAQKL